MCGFISNVFDGVGDIFGGLGDIVEDVAKPIAQVGAVIPGPWTPFAQGALALDAISNDNPLGALTSLAGMDFGGGSGFVEGIDPSNVASDSFSSVASAGGYDPTSGIDFGADYSGAAPSNNTLSDIFSQTKGFVNKTIPGGLTGMQLGSSLYDMYAKRKMSNALMDRYNQNASTISNMYAPGSPEYTLMKQAMDRKDAAAGRNSQYGTRAVDLAGTIAKLKGDMFNSSLNSQNQLYTAANQGKYGGLNSLFGYMNQNQRMSDLSKIFRK